MTIRRITTTSMPMLGLLAQVFVVCGIFLGIFWGMVFVARAEVVINTSSSGTVSVSNSVTITAGDTVVQSHDTQQSSNTHTIIKGKTTLNGVVVPESVIDIENVEPINVEIIQQEAPTDEHGRPLLERSNVMIESEDVVVDQGATGGMESESQISLHASMLARAWDAIMSLFKRLFSIIV